MDRKMRKKIPACDSIDHYIKNTGRERMRLSNVLHIVRHFPVIHRGFIVNLHE